MANSSCPDDDVIWDIFLKLPVKSLVRFKTLSIKWNSVISGPRFIRNHMFNKRRDQSHNNFIIYSNVYWETIATLEIKDNHFEGGGGSNDNHQYALKTNQIIETPIAANSVDRMRGVMHCDGLLCLFPSYHRDVGVVVWNPSTMQHKKFLRPPPNEFNPVNWEAFGFGYDSVIDDYKVVYVRGHLQLGIHVTKVQTMRLKLGLWESAQAPDVPYLFDIMGTSTAKHVNGCLYWIARSNKEDNGRRSAYLETNHVVLCFDRTGETGKMIEETSLSTHDPPLNRSSQLGFLKGCLCVAGCYPNWSSIDISLMKEDEVTKTKSWVKFMRIPSAIDITGFNCFSWNMSFIYLTNNGQVLTYERSDKIELFLCDSNDQTVRTIPLLGVNKFSKLWPIFVIPYIQSLVPP